MEQQGNSGGTDFDSTSTGSFGTGGTGGANFGTGSSSGFESGTAGTPGTTGIATEPEMDTRTGTGTPSGATGISGRIDEIRTQADKGMKSAAAGLDSLAQRIDSTAEQRLAGATGAKARAGDLAHGLADTMESVAGYLRNNDTASLQRDLERQVRERPVQTLLIGVVAGWVVGKILR